jgi:magnesium transporter
MTEIREPTLEELIGERDWFALRRALAQYEDPHDLARAIGQLEPRGRALAFRLLPRARSSEVFSLLRSDQAQEILDALGEAETRRLLADLAPDDRTALLEELPGRATQRLLNLLSPEDLAESRNLLGYPEESVGRLMTPDYVALRPWWTVGEALDHIRATGRESETINVIYVVDAEWRLLDALDIKRIILARPGQRVEELMDHTFVSLPAAADREQAVEVMQRYDLFALPITDSEGVLLGIVTLDDVLDVAQEEATEDFQRTAAVAPLGTSYAQATVRALYRKRVGWLGALVFVNVASSGVIAAYEEVLASTIALAFFIPLLIDSGGNTGAQSATLMIRALATGDVRLAQWARTLAKEIAVGLTLAVTMGLAAAALGWLRGGPEIGLVVGLAMVTIVLVANLIGTALPFLLVKGRLDPATASSPLITSLADVTGLLLYFSIASAILGVD